MAIVAAQLKRKPVRRIVTSVSSPGAWVFAIVLLTLACGGGQRGPDQAMSVDSTWVQHDLPGAEWTVRLPPSFQARNDYGCFDDLRDLNDFARDWRDICVQLVPMEKVDVFRFARDWDCDAQLAASTDCVFYEDVQGDLVRIDSRLAQREWGLRTGSIEHRSRVPEVVLRLPINDDSVAVFHWSHVRGFRDTTLARTVATTLKPVRPSGR